MEKKKKIKLFFGSLMMLVGTATCLQAPELNTQVYAAEEKEEKAIKTTVIAQPRGDTESSRSREQRGMTLSSFESTGLFLYQEEEITINIEEEPENLNVAIGQYGTYENIANVSSGSMKTYKLSKGKNVISRSDSGGMVYLQNISKNIPIKVEITGGTQVPHYIQGITSMEDFQEQLKNADQTKIPFLELVNDETISCLRIDRTKNVFLNNDQADIYLQYVTQTVQLENKAHGLFEDGTGVAKKDNQRLFVANPTSGAGSLYATNNYIGLHSGGSSDLSIFKSKLDTEQWGLFHEAGHTYQNQYMKWGALGEVTVNIYSNYVSTQMGFGDVFDYDNNIRSGVPNKGKRALVSGYFAIPDGERNFDSVPSSLDPNWVRLGMFLNLQRAFGNDFYPSLNQMYRTMSASELPKNDAEKKQTLIYLTSKLTGRNLTPFYEKWGLLISDETAAKISQFKDLEKPIWEDMLASKEEEEAGTYRISGICDTDNYSLPYADLKINTAKLVPFQLRDEGLDANDYFTNIQSKPIASAAKQNGEMAINKASYGNTLAGVNFINELGYENRFTADITITKGDSIEFNGLGDNQFMVLAMNPNSKKMVTYLTGSAPHSYFPGELYAGVSIYDENLSELKKEVTINGDEKASDKASALDGYQLKEGDIIKIYHAEASGRLKEYKDSELVAKTDNGKTFYYQVTATGLTLLNMNPEVEAANYEQIVGIKASPEDLVKKQTDRVNNADLTYTWVSEPDWIELKPQKVKVKVTNKFGLSQTVESMLTITQGNTIHFQPFAYTGLYLSLDSELKQLRSTGGNRSFLNSSTTESENYVRIRLTHENAEEPYYTFSSNGKENILKTLVPKLDGISVEIGDIIEVSQKEKKKLLIYELGQKVEKVDTPIANTYFYQITKDGWQPYEYKTGGNITIKHQDEEGISLADDKILRGNVDEAYTTEQKEIKGYTFSEVKGPREGTFTDKVQEVIYVYTKDPIKGGAITVKYQDQNGELLDATEVKEGKVGDTYVTEQKEIEGYTFSEVKGTREGTFTDKVQEVIYVYVQIIEKLGKVIIEYQNEKEQLISPEKELTGKIGEMYELPAVKIEGYTFVGVKTRLKGTFTKEEQRIVCVYAEDNSKVTGSLIIKYQEVQGTTLSPEVKRVGIVGESYKLTTPTIKGYTLKEIKGNNEGEFLTTEQTITYVYQKEVNKDLETDDKKKEIENSLSLKKQETDNPAKATPKENKNQEKNNTLPKAGETSNSFITIYGLLISLVAASIVKIKNFK